MSTSHAPFDLKKYQMINIQSKDLVNGYIRNIQSLFPSDISYYNIPLTVNYISTLYYVIIFEQLITEYETFEQLLQVVNDNKLHKDLTSYCIAKNDSALWKVVLSENNPQRKSLIDEIILQTYLSEIPDEITSSCRAFINEQLRFAVIELTEKVIQYNPNNDISNNRNLQNLLLLTVMKTEPTKVKQYIEFCNNTDRSLLAELCCEDAFKLYEEAFVLYEKDNALSEAINVLTNEDFLNDINRGKEFALKYDDTEVWSGLGREQLRVGDIQDAMVSFIKSKSVSYYEEVIVAVNDNKLSENELYEQLMEYLNLIRDKVKKDRDKRKVDTEIFYCLAKTGNLIEFEKLLSTQDSLNGYMLMKVGDRLFVDKLFKFAKIIFSKVSHYAKLDACNKEQEADEKTS
eukprot:143610_1